MENKKVIRVGSRDSKLAVAQTRLVLDEIEKNNPNISFELVTMKTTGDKILDRNLDQIGGKGLFVKELDRALIEGDVDITVHSLKDLPMDIDERIPLIGFSKREDPRDAMLISSETDIRDIKCIGTSSRRRQVQLEKIFKNAQFKGIRGNVQTRMLKLENEEYDATILAMAGLKRLGLEDKAAVIFSTEEIIPAAGQGILVLQGRKGEDYSYMNSALSKDSEYMAVAERSFVRCLEGGCSSPTAAYAEVMDDTIKLTGLYYDEMVKDFVTGDIQGSVEDCEQLGVELADRLKSQMHQKNKPGKVWLVGAGAGDIGLLTRKAQDAIERAEVVVFDALVSLDILALMPTDAELIDAGKRSSEHKIIQEDINRILVEKALEGKRVVRLKGGDPFVFGRGGEELELLAEKKIPFEVIPGITSSIAVPAYNGIPVTHRDYTSSFHVITGHKRENGELDIDFKSLVKLDATLVFLMGVASLDKICSELIRAGMRADMPAAILERGTTSRQKRAVATIATLAEEARYSGIKSPAVIVIGRVCELERSFAWFEKNKLFGKQILVTRPAEKNSYLASRLRELGAQVIEMPTIKIEPVYNIPEINEVFSTTITEILDRKEGGCLTFTSPRGVQYFFEALASIRVDIRQLFANTELKFAVVGAGTKRELEKHGIYADLMPEIYSVEKLGQLLSKELDVHTKVYMFRSMEASQEINRILDNRGIKYIEAPVYKTVYCDATIVVERVAKAFSEGDIDYVTFTSASTVQGFMKVFKNIDLSKVNAVCIGEQTKRAAQKAGIKNIQVSQRATMDSMVDSII